MRVAGIVVGCCLAVAISGCACHRTGHGFVLSSPWSLEYNRSHAPWLAFRSAKDPPCDTRNSDCVVTDKGGVVSQPDVLPWRSRLKGYHLGVRIFRGAESTGEQDAGPALDSKRPDIAID